jgi:hypothetical protein
MGAGEKILTGVLTGYFLLLLYTSGFEAAEIEEFTQEEQEFIEKTREEPIRVGIIPGTFPLSDCNEETGEFLGLTVELLDLLSQKTGLCFEYVRIDLEEFSPVSFLKAGKADMVAGVFRTENFMNDPELILSETLFCQEVVFAGFPEKARIENDSVKRVAYNKWISGSHRVYRKNVS